MGTDNQEVRLLEKEPQADHVNHVDVHVETPQAPPHSSSQEPLVASSSTKSPQELTISPSKSNLQLKVESPYILQPVGAVEYTEGADSVPVLVHPAELAKHAEIAKNKGVKLYLSRIFHGGFHLRRLAAIKDFLVPSGPQAGLWGSTFNLINATVGAGMLSLGLATSHVGIIPAALLIIAFGVLTAITINMMIRAAEISNASTYEVLMFKSFGIWGARLVDVLTIVGGFGSMIAYHVIIADFVAPVLAAVIADPGARAVVADRRFVMALFDLCIIIPLCMKKNLNSLRFTSLLSVALVTFFLVVLTYVSVAYLTVRGLPEPFRYANIDFSLFSALPLFCLSFVSHTSVFPIYAEMAKPDATDFRTITVRAEVIITVAYLLSGLMGYLAFGESVQANVISNLPGGAVVVLIVRVAYALLLACVFPFSQFTSRLSVEHLWHGIEGKFNTVRHYILTLVFVLVSFGIAATGIDVSVVFGFTGSVASAAMMLLFPGACYYRLVPGPLRSPAKIGALLCVALGVVIMVLGVTANAVSLAR